MNPHNLISDIERISKIPLREKEIKIENEFVVKSFLCCVIFKYNVNMMDRIH